MRRTLGLLMLLITVFSQAQQSYCKDDLFPRQDAKNRLWGYSNLNGDWIVSAYYDQVARFNGSIAIVNRRSHYGAVNCEGRLVFRCEYDEMLPFMGGYSWASQEGKWGLLKYDGTVVLQPQYDEVNELSTFSSYSLVRSGDIWHVYDKSTQGLLDYDVKEFKLYFNSYLHLKYLDGKHALLSVRERTFIRNEVDSLHTNRGRVYQVVDNGGHYLMKYSGVVISDTVNDLVKCEYGLYTAKRDDKWALWNRGGSALTKYQFDSIEEFSEGAAVLTIGNKKGYISASGKLVIPAIYEDAQPVDNRLAVVSIGDSTFMISRKNSQLSKSYKRILHKENSTYYVGQSERGYVILSEFGKPLIDEIFDTIMWEDSSPMVRVLNDKDWFIVNLKTGKSAGGDNTVYAESLERVFPKLSNSVIVYSIHGKKGLADSTGAKVTEAIFDRVYVNAVGDEFQILLHQLNESVLSSKEGNVLWAPSKMISLGNSTSIFGYSVKGKFGVYNLKEKKEICPSKYLDVKVLSDDFIGLKTKKGWQIAAVNGDILGEKLFFQDLKYLGEKWVPVKFDGKWGYYDPKSLKMRLAYEYDDADPFVNGSASVVISEKRVMINKRGQIIQ